jgi:hypothetical protein
MGGGEKLLDWSAWVPRYCADIRERLLPQVGSGKRALCGGESKQNPAA